MRSPILRLNQRNPRAPKWQRLFGCLFLAWLFFDLCVIHVFQPQYAAAELFGCAVPPVVASPSVNSDATPSLTAAPAALEAAKSALLGHTCFWNTQSLLDAPTIAPPPPRRCALPVVARAPARANGYAHLCSGGVFRPPRLA